MPYDDDYDDDYGYDGGYGPPPKRSKLPWIILGLVLFSILCCCGSCTGLAMFGFQLQKAEVRRSVGNDPDFREAIGDIRSLDINFEKIGNDNTSNDTYFDVVGTEGSGTLKVFFVPGPDGQQKVNRATLFTDDGREIELLQNK